MNRRVFLDGSIISRQVASGISNYVINIFKYFKINEKRTGIDTKLILNGLPVSNTHFKEAALPASDLIVYQSSELVQCFLSGSRYRNSIFHSPYMLLPPKAKHKINLLTVHDLINFEREFSFRHKLRERFLRLAILRADYYICVSHATRDRLIHHFPVISPEKIFVIYQGIPHDFFGPVSGEFISHTNKPYLLYIGLRDEYKNFNTLIDFFRDSPFKMEMDILCVGGGAFTQEEKRKLHRLNLQEVIRHAGYVTNDELKYLYRSAVALAYTSVKEGFGIPIVEAMACGCPVICGNFSSMKEIGENHAILVNDFSSDTLNAAVNMALHFSSERKMEATNYARKFTWEKTAAETLGLYQKLSDHL